MAEIAIDRNAISSFQLDDLSEIDVTRRDCPEKTPHLEFDSVFELDMLSLTIRACGNPLEIVLHSHRIIVSHQSPLRDDSG